MQAVSGGVAACIHYPSNPQFDWEGSSACVYLYSAAHQGTPFLASCNRGLAVADANLGVKKSFRPGDPAPQRTPLVQVLTGQPTVPPSSRFLDFISASFPPSKPLLLPPSPPNQNPYPFLCQPSILALFLFSVSPAHSIDHSLLHVGNQQQKFASNHSCHLANLDPFACDLKQEKKNHKNHNHRRLQWLLTVPTVCRSTREASSSP